MTTWALYSLLDLLLPFLLRQPSTGFFIELGGQLLLVRLTFLLGCHLILDVIFAKCHFQTVTPPPSPQTGRSVNESARS